MSDSSSPSPAATEAPVEGRAFGRTYWLLNSIEAFERLAYFGIRAVVPLYIMQATEPGGLHLTAMHKGTIYAWWAFFQSFLPIVTGGIADRYGYKKVLFGAISLNALGYVIMANLHNYWGFFLGILVLATGTAFFKPSLQGSLAQNLTKANSSLGWGLFYWVVNVGAFAAPFMSTAVLGKPHSLEGWQTLFYLCAGFTLCNLLILFTFKDVPSGASKTETVWQVLKRTIVNIFEIRLIIWLLIMSCFWLMMYQLWDLHPNFITDWVDSSALAAHVPVDSWWEYGDRGLIQVPQQILLNLNAGLIILLMVPLSWASSRMRTLSAMLVGMSVATCGVLLSGLTDNGWFLLLGIAFFSLGEMWTGPKKNEYLGLIAPPGKKGLYLGYVNIPVGIGIFVGSYMAGFIYDNYGEKATLALKELSTSPTMTARAAQSIDWSHALERIPGLIGIDREDAFGRAQEQMGMDADNAAQTLRQAFRHDRGQILNLGLAHLAATAEQPENIRAALVEALLESEQAERQGQGAQLRDGQIELSGDQLAQWVDLLPEATGVERANVWAKLRDRHPVDQASVPEDAAIAAELWRLYGAEPGVLNNLALEYLAQATPAVHDVVAEMTFADPVQEIPARVGIDRTQAFSALAAASGVDAAELRQRLDEIGLEPDDRRAAAFVYLAEQPHFRSTAVARHPWKKDLAALADIVRADPRAFAAAEEALGKSFDAAELADEQRALQAAFSAKNWRVAPADAERLLAMSRFEALALAAADMNRAHLRVTHSLWEKYQPNYRVWLPFAFIGVLATIALGIYGHLAKRWKDMNA